MRKHKVTEVSGTNRPQSSLAKELKRNVWLFITMVTYLVTLYFVTKHTDWSPWLKVSVTLIPVIPGVLYLHSGLSQILAMDELQRRIQFEAWMFAAMGTVVVSTVINVLNAHGIVWETFPHGLEMGGSYLVMFFMWCVGTAIANRRYR